MLIPRGQRPQRQRTASDSFSEGDGETLAEIMRCLRQLACTSTGDEACTARAPPSVATLSTTLGESQPVGLWRMPRGETSGLCEPCRGEGRALTTAKLRVRPGYVHGFTRHQSDDITLPGQPV